MGHGMNIVCANCGSTEPVMLGVGIQGNRGLTAVFQRPADACGQRLLDRDEP